MSYFEGDYKSSNTTMLNHTNDTYPNLGSDIYNGNINTMFTALSDENETALGTHQTKYTYDQLNRIKTMSGSNRILGQIAQSSGYSSSYLYDENGNLQSLRRFESGGMMDNFTYQYNDPINGGDNNRLTHIDDAISDTYIGVDIDDQNANNYVYDEIGQLVGDAAEDISSISWKVTNKVDTIKYGDGKEISFEYDPMGNRVSKRVVPATGSEITTTFYVLDAQGNPMSKYILKENDSGSSDDNLYLSERNLYGSSRIGVENIGEIIASSNVGNVDLYTGIAVNNGDKFFELSNHLGNVLEVVSDIKLPVPDGQGGTKYFTADIASFSDFMPFGMEMPGRNGSTGDYRYGFNGKESDDEVKGEKNSYDFGARMYDPRVGRFLSLDAYQSKYPSNSPFIFAGNTPIMGVDINGDSLYILTYVNGQGYRGNEMFKAAALTRKHDIENSEGFNSKRDKVILIKVQDVSGLQKKVNETVTKYSKKYGNTVEFGMWSHSGMDGPIGSKQTSANAKDSKQMTLNGWSKIDFNWAENNGNRASFYGCNTAAEYEKTESDGYFKDGNGGFVEQHTTYTTSFSNEISKLSNFKGVTVSGQVSSSFPSKFTNYRLNSENGPDNFINWESPDGSINFQRTYMVSGKRRSDDWNLNEQNDAYKMKSYKNGMSKGQSYQEGTTK